jgi:hypothetical protein
MLHLCCCTALKGAPNGTDCDGWLGLLQGALSIRIESWPRLTKYWMLVSTLKRWKMLKDVERCWKMLKDVERCWKMLKDEGNVGWCFKSRAARACRPGDLATQCWQISGRLGIETTLSTFKMHPKQRSEYNTSGKDGSTGSKSDRRYIKDAKQWSSCRQFLGGGPYASRGLWSKGTGKRWPGWRQGDGRWWSDSEVIRMSFWPLQAFLQPLSSPRVGFKLALGMGSAYHDIPLLWRQGKKRIKYCASASNRASILSKCSLGPEAEALSLLLFCKSFLRQNVNLKGLCNPLLTSAKHVQRDKIRPD